MLAACYEQSSSGMTSRPPQYGQGDDKRVPALMVLPYSCLVFVPAVRLRSAQSMAWHDMAWHGVGQPVSQPASQPASLARNITALFPKDSTGLGYKLSVHMMPSLADGACTPVCFLTDGERATEGTLRFCLWVFPSCVVMAVTGAAQWPTIPCHLPTAARFVASRPRRRSNGVCLHILPVCVHSERTPPHPGRLSIRSL